jgi:hypothetical protein
MLCSGSTDRNPEVVISEHARILQIAALRNRVRSQVRRSDPSSRAVWLSHARRVRQGCRENPSRAYPGATAASQETVKPSGDGPLGALLGPVALGPLSNEQCRFDGFDRNPLLAAFKAGQLTFLLVSVHLFFGKETDPDNPSSVDMNRRALETYGVARWCDLRRKSPNAYTQNIIALGDFNLPKVDPGDPIYQALTKRGLRLPAHSTQLGSSLVDDKHYDQIAFFPPGETEDALIRASAVFDWDGAIFKSLWADRGPKAFFEYSRYYVSDHRLLWAELAL